MRERKVDYLEEHIRQHLLAISRGEVTGDEGREINSLISLLDRMERIGDVITTRVVPLIEKKKQAGADFSAEGKEELHRYHRKIGKQLHRLRRAMERLDYSIVVKVRKKKKSYADYDRKVRRNHLERMMAHEESTMQSHVIHMELMDSLHLINLYCAQIAEILLENEALLGRSADEGDGAGSAAPADESG
jgi:phosphate:Na+ symporter